MIRAQRRRAEQPRTIRIDVKVSGEELARIDAAAEGRGMARAAFLVSAALGDLPAGPDRSVLLSELMGVRRALLQRGPTDAVMARLDAVLEEWK